MVLFVLICAAINYLICHDKREQFVEKPTIAIACAKETVLIGEPISLTITIVNRTDQEIEFRKGDPGFWACTDVGKLSFSDPKGRIVSLPTQLELIHRRGMFVVGTGRWPIVTLLPGQSWRKTIYLQRYVMPLTIGSYTISYRVELPYDMKGEKDAYGNIVSRSGKMSGCGKFNVCVKPGTATHIQTFIKQSATLLGTSDSYRAEEALCLIDSPIAIPHLVTILSRHRTYQNMLLAFIRIANRHSALAAVRACLKNTDPHTVANALYVLQEEKEVLVADEVEQLLSSTHPIVADATVRYFYTLSRSVLPLSEFQKFASSKHLSTRLLLYVTFPRQCNKTWTTALLHDVHNLVRAVPPVKFAQLLRDLDDDAFVVRENASAKLVQLGERVESQLQQALRTDLSPEAKRRVQSILEAIATAKNSPEWKSIVEHLSSGNCDRDAAVAVLRALAKGTPDAALTKAAVASLNKLSARK